LKKKNWLVRKLGDVSDNVSKATSDAVRNISDKVSEKSKQLEEEYGVGKTLKSAANASQEFISYVDQKHHVLDKAKNLKDTFIDTGTKMSEEIKTSGVLDKAEDIQKSVNKKVSTTISNYAIEIGMDTQFDKILKLTESSYGDVRAFIKPYYAPETPKELLENTKKELIYINSCILQISADEAEKLANKLGSAVLSKVAGAASVGVLLSMVSTFGTAGTGTAIAGLSGAAATNATLAWVGGLLGGGMATGAVLTGGIALTVCVGVYKLISSNARQFEKLNDKERQIIESTAFLIAAINDLLKNSDITLDSEEAQLLLNNTLKPLHQTLIDETDNITKNLDKKNSVLFRQHALTDFKNVVIDGFEFFINDAKKSSHRYPEYVIAGVIYSLLSNSPVDDSIESQIALDAIKRMRNEWNDATETQLNDALADYEPEQLKGIANNVKGIYHELLFVDNYNKQNTETYAILFEETNHAGADVQIRVRDDDQVLREFQLKSTDSMSYVNEHIERYPDIEVLVTEELASKDSYLDSSGISNDEITDHIDEIIGQMSNNSITDRAFESGELAGLVVAGKETIDILRGKQTASGAGAEVAKSAIVVSSSTLLASYLFS